MNFLLTSFITKSYAKHSMFIHLTRGSSPGSVSPQPYRWAAICKKFCLINIGVLLFLTGNAQFYYTDIVLTGRNMDQLNLYKSNKVKQIKLLSYEASGEPSENFICEVSLDTRYNKIITFTQSPAGGSSLLTVFYLSDGKLARSVDSSSENVNTYTYTYNENGKLAVANSVSATVKGKDQQSETHVWIYNSNYQPQKMLWIKNGNDTSIVQFKTDEAGNVIEEELFYKGISKDVVYYYYDNENRLTDIVRYNDRLKKLIPDNVFEYNDGGKVSQMLSVQNGSDYLIWRYEYDTKGLKTRELCYNKQKKLVGRIEYQYGFNN